MVLILFIYFPAGDLYSRCFCEDSLLNLKVKVMLELIIDDEDTLSGFSGTLSPSLLKILILWFVTNLCISPLLSLFNEWERTIFPWLSLCFSLKSLVPLLSRVRAGESSGTLSDDCFLIREFLGRGGSFYLSLLLLGLSNWILICLVDLMWSVEGLLVAFIIGEYNGLSKGENKIG